MIKPILTGVWVCAVTMGSAYVGAAWQRPATVTDKPDHSTSNDLVPIRTRMISVPVVADGGIRDLTLQHAVSPDHPSARRVDEKSDEVVPRQGLADPHQTEAAVGGKYFQLGRTLGTGLVAAPVIGVPTSVGYGVAAGGWAATVSMLASCSPGLVVVNVDNGFGAAVHAARIVRGGRHG